MPAKGHQGQAIHLEEAVVEGCQLRRHGLSQPRVREDLRDARPLGRHRLQHARHEVPAQRRDLRWRNIMAYTPTPKH